MKYFPYNCETCRLLLESIDLLQKASIPDNLNYAFNRSLAEKLAVPQSISKHDLRSSRVPHNLFMLNLALFHLLMTPAAIALDIGIAGMLVPLGLSIATMLYTRHHAHALLHTASDYVVSHWQLALKRYRFLLISYLLTAGLLFLGWLIAMASPDPNMQSIIQTVFIRIAVMPVLIMVMICFYLESSSISLISRTEPVD